MKIHYLITFIYYIVGVTIVLKKGVVLATPFFVL